MMRKRGKKRDTGKQGTYGSAREEEKIERNGRRKLQKDAESN